MSLLRDATGDALLPAEAAMRQPREDRGRCQQVRYMARYPLDAALQLNRWETFFDDTSAG